MWILKVLFDDDDDDDDDKCGFLRFYLMMITVLSHLKCETKSISKKSQTLCLEPLKMSVHIPK